jgi:hypothetical protein
MISIAVYNPQFPCGFWLEEEENKERSYMKPEL